MKKKDEHIRVLAAFEKQTTEFVCNRAMLNDYIKRNKEDLKYLLVVVEDYLKDDSGCHEVWHWSKKNGWTSLGFIMDYSRNGKDSLRQENELHPY